MRIEEAIYKTRVCIAVKETLFLFHTLSYQTIPFLDLLCHTQLAALESAIFFFLFIIIMTKIAIIHYSMYGHVATMSESVKKGVEAVAGVECDIYQVAETLPEEVLGKMHAPPKGDYPIMTADKMPEYDGFLFGLSGRYGMLPAQMKVRLMNSAMAKIEETLLATNAL